ncbi:MAG: hypothetical protein V3U27_13540, partial [Candidatus Tectomicrobia bacterium]
MKHVLGVALALVLLFAGVTLACAGHGVVYYPSFYPQEIRLEAMDPAAAGASLQNNSLHAYIGATPRFTGTVPDHLKSAESLDAFLVLTFNPASAAFKQVESRCATAHGVLAALGEGTRDVILTPYPITPYHPDYLQHLDRVNDAKARVEAPGAISPALRVRARGEQARALVQSRWKLSHDDWDVSLEEVPVARLVSGSGAPPHTWPGPPWMKAGWFHA